MIEINEKDLPLVLSIAALIISSKELMHSQKEHLLEFLIRPYKEG